MELKIKVTCLYRKDFYLIYNKNWKEAEDVKHQLKENKCNHSKIR